MFILNLDKVQTGLNDNFFRGFGDGKKFICSHVKRFVYPKPVHVACNSRRHSQPCFPFPVPRTLRQVLESELSYGLHLTCGFLVILSFSVPSGPPRNVEIDSTTSTSFTLTWDPPLEPNGIILGYHVRYSECDKSNKTNICDNITESKHTIEGLHPYRCYGMHVACESNGGLGAYSDWFERRTKPGSKCGDRVLSCFGWLEKTYVYQPRSQCLLREIPGVWYSWFGFLHENNNQ